MEVILSNQCQSFTGALGKGYGYSIVHRKNGFFAQRNSKGTVPSDGHIRFIFECAKMAQTGFFFSNIKIHWQELYNALYEAYHFVAADKVGWNGREAKKIYYNAQDIINLKTTFGL